MSYLINCMLTNLPDEEFKILSSNMQLVSLKRGISLFDKWEIAQFIYFTIGVTVSMLNAMEDGTSVGVYTGNNTGCPSKTPYAADANTRAANGSYRACE